MNDLFRFCYGNDARYDPKHKIMASIDDFNTGIRAAECQLTKSEINEIAERIKGGDNRETQGVYTRDLLMEVN